MAPFVVDLPRETLEGDTATVREALDGVDDPVVLLGHSYGGMVITGAAAGRDDVAHLVYLAAFMPDEGQSLLTLVEDAPVATLRPALLEVDQQTGTSTVRADVVRKSFYDDCSAEEVKRAIARLRPHAVGCFAVPPPAVAWKDIPSTYVVCTKDEAIHPDLQRQMAQRTTRVIEWPTGHSPFLSPPDLVVDLLTDLAR